MPTPISAGSPAPNFDLSSTEDCLLMLQDEVVRTAVVVYFFADAEEATVRQDLQALAAAKDDLARRHAKVLAVSPLKVDVLKELQVALDLRYPLLCDDRNLAAAYGFAFTQDDEGETIAPAPLLAVVDRNQTILHLAHGAGISAELPALLKMIGGLPSPTAGYPKKVVNRLVDRWVNRG